MSSAVCRTLSLLCTPVTIRRYACTALPLRVKQLDLACSLQSSAEQKSSSKCPLEVQSHIAAPRTLRCALQLCCMASLTPHPHLVGAEVADL